MYKSGIYAPALFAFMYRYALLGGVCIATLLGGLWKYDVTYVIMGGRKKYYANEFKGYFEIVSMTGLLRSHFYEE